MKWFCLGALFLFYLRCSTAELSVVPPNKEIEVIEGESYRFGVEEDDSTNITRCCYETNTKLADCFDVVKKAPPEESRNITENVAARGDHNIITNSGPAGQCKLWLQYVDDQGPTRWTLTPFDKKTGKNLTSIEYNIRFFYKAKLLTDKIAVRYGQGFFQYINQTNIDVKTCTLKFGDITLSHNAYKGVDVFTSNSKENDETSKKITFLSNYCGFQLVNASKSENYVFGSLTAAVKGYPDKKYRAEFRPIVVANPAVLHKVKEIELAGSAFITCDPECRGNYYCNLYNPKGEFVPSGRFCDYSIAPVTMSDFGVWTLSAGSNLGVDPVNFTVKLVLDIIPKSFKTWVRPGEGNSYNIGCQKMGFSSTYPPDYCTMTLPNQEVLVLQPGVVNDRYIPLKTDLANGVCAVEVPKPLLHKEKGLWKCELRIGASPAAAFIHVESSKDPTYPKRTQVTLQLEQKYTIICRVPYASPYCNVMSPEGVIYQAAQDYDPRVGLCAHIIENVTAAHNGTWTCNFAKETGVSEEQIFVEVTVAEVLQYYKLTEADAGSSAQLLCKSGGLPLVYCRFIAPNGTSYYIENNKTTNTISYYGDGLQYGQCGISIANTQPSDSGNWTCVALIGRSSYAKPPKEISATLMLEVSGGFFSNTNIAAAVGIAVGVVVVTTVLVAAAFSRWRRRRRNAPQPAGDVRSSELGDEFENETVDIFSIGPPPRSYTNPFQEEERPHQN